MKKTPSEDLFRLIQSLNRGEKRNFKLLAGLLSTEKDKKYIELFDAIDKQGTYDEPKLGRALKYIYGGQLSVGKNYLYKLILKSLVHFRQSAQNEITTILEQTKILFEKELYSQANKLLKKGLIIAKENEDFQNHYALLCIEGDILMAVQSERYLVMKVNENAKQRRLVLSQLQNWEELHALANQLLLMRKAHRLNMQGALAREALEHRALPILQDAQKALSNRGRVEFFNIHRVLCSFENDLENAARYCEALIKCCEEMPAIKGAAVRTYYSALYNQCIYLLKQGDAEAGTELLEKFRAYRDEGSLGKADFFQAYYVLLAAISLQIGKPDKVIDALFEIEEEWQLLEGKLQQVHELRLQFWIAYAFFMDNQPKQALKWINQMLNQSHQDFQADLISNGKLLNILVHLELGNYSLVESEASSTRRYLEKHGRFNEFEKQMLKCARALSRAGNGPEFNQVLQVWYKKWQQLEQDPQKGSWILTVEGWLNQKVTGEKMAEHQKNKNKLLGFTLKM